MTPATAILIYALEDKFGNKEILVANSEYDIVQATKLSEENGMSFEFESDARHLKGECAKAGITCTIYEQTLHFFNGKVHSVDITEVE